ncbi:MAG: hypothetical protein Q4G09_07875 [Clostridia bacterium]|nr:hypothetical protein [Clostridia bacterium]
MRYWNGLSLNSKVIYLGKIFRVRNLYELKGQRLCDLVSTDELCSESIGISVFDCEKIDEQ